MKQQVIWWRLLVALAGITLFWAAFAEFTISRPLAGTSYEPLIPLLRWAGAIVIGYIGGSFTSDWTHGT